MGSHDPFGHLKHNIWPKEGQELNYQFDSHPLKVKNCPNFFMCKWRATYYWKSFNKGYNFALNFTSIKGLHTKLWAFKVVGVSISRILRLQLGSPMTKWHLGVGFMANHKEYYKGEGGCSPQI
jgi:hypothetical protein